ncbi:hypothetical protein TTHERM_00245130 (macronuclear) [Tetrahymena thermophila SB210]|uniref:Uncharacterized protein n=1 Tax=Tetrahymena thermophila (strain SB210) TaxID=312017 RepID=Q245Y5_TETTS|nr:hypothetical protein TTHERM_00245130 [Tetrahymena thermophila SB210]EAS03498.2 hypothetical protein TTHERM_00245130 [Tetrahymena thermophila SB210]|eukprot:XP_001023743.2 hypothetical protein TTHERM_00245130 [Tetrahymena thermophila SB210]
MFKKRKDTKKEQVIIEDNSDLAEKEQASKLSEQAEFNKESKEIFADEEIHLVKPVVYKKPISNQLSFVENEEEADHNEADISDKIKKEKPKKINMSSFLRNDAADIDYSNLQNKQSDFYQSAYDINELRNESNKVNQQTLSFIEQLKQDKENGVIEEEELYQMDPSEYDQKVNQNIQNMEIEYSQSEKQQINSIKEQRQTQKSTISSDDYIKLCGQGDFNMVNNMENRRMAMFGDIDNQKNNFEVEQDDISDEEFNQMEEAFVQNAMKHTNLVNRDFTFINQKGSLQQMKRKKEESQLIANLDKINLKETIQLIESNHLTNFKIKNQDEEKKKTITQVVQKSKQDIEKWNEEIKIIVEQESAILENIEFWREFNDMMNEKSKELKVAFKENDKLNKRFLFSNEKRLSSYTNSFLQEMGLPLIKRKHHGEDEAEDLYETFPSNIRRSAIQEKRKLQAKHEVEGENRVDGFSSDEDSDLPEEDRDINDTKDFIDEKVALASAALGIMDEIEDYYKDFQTYLKYSSQYNELDNSIQTEDILFSCLQNQVQVELFTYDPLGRYSSQLNTDINTISFMNQINTEQTNENSIHKELVSKVKQKIMEKYVFDKLLQEILYCYNPYSLKQTVQLQISFLQLADISYISSQYKSKEVQTIFQKVITAVINKFEEYFTYTSSFPSSLDSTKINSEYQKFCIGRNLRLFSNILALIKMVPASAIYSLGFEKIVKTSLQIINIFTDPQMKAFYLAKFLVQIPLEVIDRNNQIKQSVIQISDLLDVQLESINNEIRNLNEYEKEQLYQLKERIQQLSE